MKEEPRMDAERNLEGRVIAVAGVGGGLGPAVATRLAEAGAIIAGANRGQADVDAGGGGGVDFAGEAPVAGWRDALVEPFGPVDGLVRLVGGWRGGQPLHE